MILILIITIENVDQVITFFKSFILLNVLRNFFFPSSHQSKDRLADLVAEHLDHLHYLNDILCLNIDELNEVLVEHLLNRLLIPLYVYSLTKRKKYSNRQVWKAIDARFEMLFSFPLSTRIYLMFVLFMYHLFVLMWITIMVHLYYWYT